jgi:hypothetical protein
MIPFFMSALLGSWIVPWQSSDWSEFRWENRVVLVMAGGDSKEMAAMALEWQNPRIERAIEDRRIKVLIAQASSEPALRKRAGVAPDGFALVLIGLDGGVKFRSTKAVSPEEIFQQIDQMPMGRREKEARER